ncbi:hypothetical protein CBR_g37226 [Chara braunii]|uniref:Uncharacterized protein n=1 Tax=Chara braunii TaxID=69332 RepID=A0A388LMT5_CHABU|nr:hypothetical protein CBR_g37226 [Chara braunii]|eukprot:GBG83512.1 hypothetical protein CBR_g37226 [Chara braunii]
MEEGEGDNMDCEQDGKTGTERGSTSTKRKGEARGETGSNSQDSDLQQGKRRQKTQSGREDAAGNEEGESAESLGKARDSNSNSMEVTSRGSGTGEEGTGTAGEREDDLVDNDHPEGSSQYEEDKCGSRGAQDHESLEDEEMVRERARKKGMQNVDNMTVQQILQAEEDQRESSKEEDNESSMGEEEEEEEEDQEDADAEDWTRDRWIKEVEQLEWGRTTECEIRLAHHKHLRNLQLATQAGEDITSENRFELLRREGEINEFYASQYARKSCTIRNEIHIQQEEYGRLFQWPKSYHNKERKGNSGKRKAQLSEEQGSSTNGMKDSMEGAAMEEDQEKRESEEEEVQDLRRQAAILVVQVNLLKDENRELEDDTVNMQR